MSTGSLPPRSVDRQRAPHGGDLALEPHGVEPGSRAAYSLRLGAEEGRGERGRRGRVPDAHLAERDDADAVVGELRSHSHPCGEALLRLFARHRRPLGQVSGARAGPEVADAGDGRADDPEVEDVKLGTHEACEDADRRAAAREVRQHLRGHLLRIRADAPGGDTVVGGGDHDRGPQPPGGGRPADRGDADGEVLQPAETAAGLRLGVERGARRGRGGIRRRQAESPSRRRRAARDPPPRPSSR